MPRDASEIVIEGKASQATSQIAAGAKKKKSRTRYRSPAERLSIAAVKLTVLGYVAILLALALMETRLVYPGAYMEDPPDQEAAATSIETVEYTSSDGVTLKGRLLEREQAEHIVLFFHGNAVKARWMDRWLQLLSAEFNATAMIAEYRGFEDQCAPDEQGVLADCFAARDYLCSRYQKSPSDLILYGRSLGGGCAVAVAAQGGAKAMVLDRTFDRLVDVAAGKYPFVPVHWLMRNRYDSLAKLTVYKGPLVVLHGTADEIIPYRSGETLFAAAACSHKHWIAVQGLGHNDSLPLSSLREVVGKVREFTAGR
jgi:hypothetical protein